ncbi:MAG: pilus assembly protein PilM [Alistipes sp.]|nr:pilus assembly protein PilM [Alistipes sp.]
MAKKETKTNQKNRYLTINFNNEFIKVGEVSKTNKGLMVHKVFSIPTPPRSYRDGVIRDRNAIAKELTIVLQRHGISTTNVIYTISSTKIATKEVVIPYVAPKKVDSIVRMNATEYFPVNIDEYIIQNMVLETIVNKDNPKKKEQLKLLVAAVPAKMIEEYYDFSSTMGLKVVAIDYLGNSTLQLLKTQSDVETSVMVQIENDSTIISVFSNDVLQLQRTVPYGKTMIVNAVMEKRKIFNYDVALDILTKEQLIHTDFDGDDITESMRYLVSNVSRIMDYQTSRNSNKPVDKIYLVGNATYILGLEDLFRNNLSAPVESISFLKGVEADKRTYVEETTLTTYIANIGAVIDPLNFSPEASASAASDKKGGGIDVGQMKLVLGIAVLGAALLIVLPYIQMNLAEQERDEAQSRLDGIRNIEEVMAEYNAAKSQFDDVNNFKLLTVNNNDSLGKFITDLEGVLPSDMYIETISVDDGVVSVTGTASSKYTVAKTVMQLKSISNVGTVFNYNMSEKRDENDNITVSFQLTCSFYDMELLETLLSETAGEE